MILILAILALLGTLRLRRRVVAGAAGQIIGEEALQ